MCSSATRPVEQHVEPQTLSSRQQYPPPPNAGSTNLPPHDVWPGGQHNAGFGTKRFFGQHRRAAPFSAPLVKSLPLTRISSPQPFPCGQQTTRASPGGPTKQHEPVFTLQQT
jgi:hypothetical protein